MDTSKDKDLSQETNSISDGKITPIKDNLKDNNSDFSSSKELSPLLKNPLLHIIENEYLEDFYRDMKRYSFSFQIYLLNCRFRQHQQVLWNGTGGIQDRTLYEDSIFAKVLYEEGNMEEREYKTYLNLLEI